MLSRVAIGFLFSIAVLPLQSYALTCAEEDPKQSIEEGNAFIFGTVTNVTRIGRDQTPGLEKTKYEVTFEVERAWSNNGIDKQIVTVQSVLDKSQYERGVLKVTGRYFIELWSLPGGYGISNGACSYAVQLKNADQENNSQQIMILSGLGRGYVPEAESNGNTSDFFSELGDFFRIVFKNIFGKGD